jgi:tetratricopeptide (TPR) repeat protein
MRYGAAVVCFVLAAGLASASHDPAELLEQIDAGVLEAGRAVELTSVRIDLGPATLDVDRGVLIPAAPVAGRSAEFVLVGEVRFRITPPDSLEASQLRLFTGRGALDVEVDRAVLVLASDATVDSLMARSVVERLDAEVLGQAEELFDEWLESADRRRYRVGCSLLKDALGDAAFADFFTVWCDSSDIGRFHFAFDPNATEQVALGRFVPQEQSDIAEYRQQKWIRLRQWEGWFLEWAAEDAGSWDVWLSQSWRIREDRPAEGHEGFEPERYTVDAELLGPRLDLTARAVIDARALEAGRRAIDLILFPDLRVRRVTDAAGRELFFRQRRWNVAVVLPEPTEVGQPLSLAVEYGGPILRESASGGFALRSTTHWHPHAGTKDRALYDVTVRRPKKLQYFATGRRVDEGKEGRVVWERRRMDDAAKRFTFEVGDFATHRLAVGGVDVLVAISKAAPPPDQRYVRELLETVEQVVTYAGQRFGDFPTAELTVVTVDRPFSQGSDGFVTLSRRLLRGADPRARTNIVGHEFAHIWWGNRIGWRRYRDQWLSEAIADYFATLFAQYRFREVSSWASLQNLHAALSRRAANGRRLESLGPPVLGNRLDSSLSDHAYPAIVYGKGSAVFWMLAEEIGPLRFLDILEELSTTWSGRVVDTELFLEALEQLSGRDLSAFCERFIYGTGTPRLIGRYEAVPAGDRWKIKGTLELHVLEPSRFSLRPTPGGGWDVVVDRQRPVDPSDWSFSLPVFVGQSEMDRKQFHPTRRFPVERTAIEGLRGSVKVNGGRTAFEIPVREKPTFLQFDPDGRTVAVVFDEMRLPGNALHERARALAATGRLAEAEETLRAALTADGGGQDGCEVIWGAPEPPDPLTRAMVLLDLAELLLDLGRDGEALEAVRLGKSALPPVDRSPINETQWLLEARIHLRAGRFGKAYAELKKTLRLDFLQRADDSIADAVRRINLRSGVIGDGQAYAMLALAAHYTDREAVCRRATEEAIRRNADMTPLIAEHQSSGAP